MYHTAHPWILQVEASYVSSLPADTTEAEPVFGHIKEPRGFRRFSLRGVVKVRAEWTLVCLCNNLIKLLAAQPDLADA